MKKNDLIIIAGALVYSILFYHQQAGINFLLFNLFLLSALLIKEVGLISKSSWRAVAIGCIASSAAVLLYGNTLAVVANLISIVILASFSFNSSSSLLIAGIHSSYTFISAIPYIVIRNIHPEVSQEEKENNWGIKFLIVALPFVVALIFFFIYRSANPVFKSYTDFSFDFISFEWIRFVLLGWLLLYAFFNQVHIPYLFTKDENGTDALKPNQYLSEISLPRINYENLSGIVLFSLLNALILFLNIIDFQSILFSNILPDGVTHSELVHQGVELLIVSILIAISIILFYFRGALNFSNNTAIKVLAYLWIVQNIVLLITTGIKNQWYVAEFSLTYKRIGVYFYLLLTLVGLITTFIKIFSTKSNWFLFRKNAWIFYSILIISSFFNWDLIITEYNLKNSKNVDRRYLSSLSPSSLPELLKEKKSLPDTIEANYDYSIYSVWNAKEDIGWQSYNFEDTRVEKELDSILPINSVYSLNLSNRRIESITCLKRYSNLEHLNLSNTQFKALEQLANFKKLKSLDLSKTYLNQIDSLPSLPQLTFLNLAATSLTSISVLSKFPHLTELDIRENTIYDLSPISKLKELKILHVNQLSQTQISELKEKFPSLEIDFSSIYQSPAVVRETY